MTLLTILATVQVILSLWFAFNDEWPKATYWIVWFAITTNLSYAKFVLDKLNQIN